MTDVYVPFVVESEPWNLFALRDGTKLRIRLVVLKIARRVEDNAESFDLSPTLLIATETPPEKRGPPGRTYTADELRVHRGPTMKFEPIEKGASIYRVSNTHLLRIETTLETVKKTSFFGPDGEPQYFVETSSILELRRIG